MYRAKSQSFPSHLLFCSRNELSDLRARDSAKVCLHVARVRPMRVRVGGLPAAGTAGTATQEEERGRRKLADWSGSGVLALCAFDLALLLI